MVSPKISDQGGQNYQPNQAKKSTYFIYISKNKQNSEFGVWNFNLDQVKYTSFRIHQTALSEELSATT